LPAYSDVLRPGDSRPETGAALRAWLDLQRALALRPQVAKEILERTRDPRAALRLAGEAPAPAARLDQSVAALERAGAVAVPFGSDAYPERLAALSDAAPLLLVRGDVAALAGPCVAVVGARAASAYGRSVVRRFAADLAAAGLVIVSGLALGIDAIAHDAALEAGGRTLAVQACGPERVYPARHRSLAQRICQSGAVVTEFAPGTPPQPAYFPLRNRLISGLSLAVLVVEARERSGSLITAGHAARQGVDVFAVPGPIHAPTSTGTNALLFHGAGVALSPEVILEELRRQGGLPTEPPRVAGETSPDAPARPADPRERERQRIVAALLDEPLSRDQLGRRLERSPEELCLALLELELSGRVAEDRDGRLRVVS
jgi:DNA processing protein